VRVGAYGLLTAYRVFGPVDLKNLRREGLLIGLSVLMGVLVLLYRYGVPSLARTLDARFGFDLTPYYDLAMSLYVGTASGTAGMIVGFLLLDERDDRTLTALLVTPLPVGSYLAYRITVPLALSFVLTAVTYPLVGLAPVGAVDVVVISGLAAFGGPTAALFLATFAENKITGLALTKVINALGMLPVLAYFLPARWELLAGVLPGYWPMKVVWLAVAGEPYGWQVVAGLAVNVGVVWWLLRRFDVVVRRA
jgi:fluoroquinolone transport system permease protein